MKMIQKMMRSKSALTTIIITGKVALKTLTPNERHEAVAHATKNSIILEEKNEREKKSLINIKRIKNWVIIQFII